MDSPAPQRSGRWWTPLLLVHAALVVAVLVARPLLPPTSFDGDGPGALHGVVFATQVLLGAPWWVLSGVLPAVLPLLVNLVLHVVVLRRSRRRAPLAAPGSERHRPVGTSARLGLAVLAGLAVWAAWLGWDDTTSYDVVTRQDESPYVTLQVLGCALTVGVVTALLAARWSPVVAATGVSVGFWWAWTAWAAAYDDTGLFLVGALMLAVGLAAGTSFAAFVGVVVAARRSSAPGLG
ncbi:hypothetical protein [Quadrisphaera sp. INWT6]|uniref:hypothetical protein n=1 Tax=Quadrisphaera sp. INWT6 TaxID=2596917 RepID=UPI0018924FA8|nr:hypothetical protein [Quadrisphaera sp. INWT6]MBF5083609.1 hypothetical protein [Quadrisphaera sp. INWT6]